MADLHIAVTCTAYPEENLFKLNQRLAKAYEALQDFPNAELAHKNMIKNLEFSQLKPEQKQQLKNEAFQSIRICQKRSTLKSFTTFDQKFDQIYLTFSLTTLNEYSSSSIGLFVSNQILDIFSQQFKLVNLRSQKFKSQIKWFFSLTLIDWLGSINPRFS